MKSLKMHIWGSPLANNFCNFVRGESAKPFFDVFSAYLFANLAKGLKSIFEQFFWSGESLNDIYDDLKAKEDLVGIESIFYEIYEDSIAQDGQELQKDDLTARFKRVSKVSLMRQEDLLESRISFLSTVASASPYIGLFGTVWGIMNSFRGLAQTSQATLSVVAPGISEALIATALGLFAAIPALIAYNFFVKRINTILNRYESFIEEFQNLLAR